MRRQRGLVVLTSLFAVLGGTSLLQAEEPAAEADFFDPIKNIQLSDDGSVWVSFGGHARTRYEQWSNFGFVAGNDDGFLLTRVILNADLHVDDNIRIFAEGKEAVSTNRSLPGGQRTMDTDEFELQQLYADIKIDLGDQGTLTLRPGRQALKFGKERLVSPLPWSNSMRSWDGISAVWDAPFAKITGFWTQFNPVQKYNFNSSAERDIFYGVYATMPVHDDAAKADLYFLGRSRDLVAFNGTMGDEDRYTLGGRLFGKCDEGRIDYDVEGAYQFGDIGSGDINAYMIGSQVGYNFIEYDSKPRVWVGFDYASGDDSATDSDVETFDQLYPLGHAFLGYIDVVGRQNIIDLSTGYSVKPCKDVKVALAGHYFWRASTNDALYNAGGGVVRADVAGADRDLGAEVDLTVNYKINKNLSLLLGYSHFFATGFVSDTGAADDIDFAYSQLLLTF